MTNLIDLVIAINCFAGMRGQGKGHNGYQFDCSLLGLDIGNVALLKNKVTYYTHIHRWR